MTIDEKERNLTADLEINRSVAVRSIIIVQVFSIIEGMRQEVSSERI